MDRSTITVRRGAGGPYQPRRGAACRPSGLRAARSRAGGLRPDRGGEQGPHQDPRAGLLPLARGQGGAVPRPRAPRHARHVLLLVGLQRSEREDTASYLKSSHRFRSPKPSCCSCSRCSPRPVGELTPCSIIFPARLTADALPGTSTRCGSDLQLVCQCSLRSALRRRPPRLQTRATRHIRRRQQGEQATAARSPDGAKSIATQQRRAQAFPNLLVSFSLPSSKMGTRASLASTMRRALGACRNESRRSRPPLPWPEALLALPSLGHLRQEERACCCAAWIESLQYRTGADTAASSGGRIRSQFNPTRSSSAYGIRISACCQSPER